ncbi:MAG: aminoglycoside phosphotransferase, partial [Parafilimonas terrae]|nr:aminoglycoside phosphotransferase [Parafilimonas terrae]
MGIQFGPDVLADLESALRAALPRWGLPPDATFSLLNVSENATYRIDDPGRDRTVVLRVHRLNYHEIAEIRSEIAWIEALRREGVVETPEP